MAKERAQIQQLEPTKCLVARRLQWNDARHKHSLPSDSLCALKLHDCHVEVLTLGIKPSRRLGTRLAVEKRQNPKAMACPPVCPLIASIWAVLL